MAAGVQMNAIVAEQRAAAETGMSPESDTVQLSTCSLQRNVHTGYSGVIIIIIISTMFMVLSSRQSHCESSPGSFDECRMMVLEGTALLKLTTDTKHHALSM